MLIQVHVYVLRLDRWHPICSLGPQVSWAEMKAHAKSHASFARAVHSSSGSEDNGQRSCPDCGGLCLLCRAFSVDATLPEGLIKVRRSVLCDTPSLHDSLYIASPVTSDPRANLEVYVLGCELLSYCAFLTIRIRSEKIDIHLLSIHLDKK